MFASRRTFAVALLALAGLCASAHAQTVPVDAQAGIARRIKSASVRVRVDARGPGTFYGSGVCVAQDTHPFIVTNNHVIEDAEGKIEVCADGGKWTVCSLVVTDTKMDLAVLDAGRAVGTHLEPVAFSEHHRYEVAGFAGDGKYHTHKVRPRQWNGIGLGPYSWVEFSGTCCQGDSGGGIFNARGGVIGVVWGKGEDGGSHVMGVVGRPFRNILSRATEKTQ